MRAHYRDMLTELSGIMNEQVWLCNGRWVSRLVLLPRCGFLTQSHGVMSIIFSFALFHETFSCASASYFSLLLFELLLSLQLQKSVLAASTSSLSNSSLSALSKTGMSCHQIPSWKTSMSHCYLLSQPIPIYPTAKTAFPDTWIFLFQCNAFLFSLLSRFLTQDNQERNGTAPTEWPIDTREILCAREGLFFFLTPPPPRHPKKMASESTSLSLKATHLLVSDCSCFPLQGAAHLVELWLRKQGKKCVDRGRDSL